LIFSQTAQCQVQIKSLDQITCSCSRKVLKAHGVELQTKLKKCIPTPEKSVKNAALPLKDKPKKAKVSGESLKEKDGGPRMFTIRDIAQFFCKRHCH